MIIPHNMTLREARRYLREQARDWPSKLVQVPESCWPAYRGDGRPKQLWRSKSFVAQVYPELNGAIRVSISRNELQDERNWKDGITWDELMEVKRQIGFGDQWSVEIYPADSRIVNVANMRHLWVLNEAPKFAWKSEL